MKQRFIVKVQWISISILLAIGASDVCCLNFPTEFQEDYQQFPFPTIPISDPVSIIDAVISNGNNELQF
jgi:hypothetical protein